MKQGKQNIALLIALSRILESVAIHQSSTFDSQSAKADTINRFLTEQADRLDKVCG